VNEWPEGVRSVPLRLSRHAVSPRHVARAGELWRMCQDAAIEASTMVGWPATRYRDEAVGFVVSQMTLVHHRELTEADTPSARTWVADFRRGMLSRREVRLFAGEAPLATATQKWVHVAIVDGELKPARASADLLRSLPFVEVAGAPSAALPHFEPAQGPVRRFEFTSWYAWMDPLAHANHPQYVDWADEATARVLAEAGLDPFDLVPVAEHVRFRGGVVAGEALELRTRLIGRTEAGAVVLEHEVAPAGGGPLAATVTTVRTLVGGPGALAAAFGA
jgi:acyl-CoA thioesterase FadM